MSLKSKIQALITAANAKTGETDTTLTDAVQTLVDGYGGGITPSGSVTLTEENTYDVTAKATAVVDFSATRANLAEAVTAKGVDTLPTSSFDTIATNIGLISGGDPTPSAVVEITEAMLGVTLKQFATRYIANAVNANSVRVVNLTSSNVWHITEAYIFCFKQATYSWAFKRYSNGGVGYGTADNVNINVGDRFEVYEIDF